MTRKRFSAVLIPDAGRTHATRRVDTAVDARALARSEARRILNTDADVESVEIVVLDNFEAFSAMSEIIRRN